jgi:prophage regulatory protein
MRAKEKALPLPAHDLPTCTQPVPPLVLIRLPEVLRRTSLSKTTVYQMIADQSFPSKINLGGKAIAFLSHEVDQWIADRVAASRGGVK